MSTFDEKASRERVNQVMGELLDKYPEESPLEHFNCFSKKMKDDPSLREALLQIGFMRLSDELLNELVRQGKPVAEALRKPNYFGSIADKPASAQRVRSRR